MIRIQAWPDPAPRVLALGFFDGVHLGHRALLRAAVDWGREMHCPAWVLTFSEHPMIRLCPDRMPPLLTTLEERRALLEEMGLEGLVELPFTGELAQMEPRAFLEAMQATGAKGLVAGYNYSFGRNGSGKSRDLLGGPVAARILPEVLVEGEPVSSSRIREMLARGETRQAWRLLGRPYGVSGRVKRGKQLGRTLHFPTVNLLPPKEKALPAWGVYTGWVNGAPAVINVGPNPTVEEHAPVKVESHVLWGQVPDYGDLITVTLGQRLRGEVRFPSVEALQRQVMLDKDHALAWHQENSQI